MNTKFLFSHKFQKPGFILLLLGLVLGGYYIFVDSEPEWLRIPVFALLNDELFKPLSHLTFINDYVLDEAASILIILGGSWFGFSKEKTEDEFIAKLRLESLLIAIRSYYFILLLTVIFIYGTSFFYVMIFSMFIPLLIFIVRFRFILYQTRKSSEWAID